VNPVESPCIASEPPFPFTPVQVSLLSTFAMMKPLPTSRATARSTAAAVGQELGIVFPKAVIEYADKATAHSWRAFAFANTTKPRIAWDAAGGRVLAFIYGSDTDVPEQAIGLRPLRTPDTVDLQLANAFMRVFDDDVCNAPLMLRHDELWETLTLSRISRSIARLTAFSTAPFLRWLSAFEAAAHLRYEGTPFHASAFMTKQRKWIAEVAGPRFIPFKESIQFRQALLGEKWVRTIESGADLGLVGLGHTGAIIGVVVVPRPKQSTSIWFFLPNCAQRPDW
jgi:hypothetical protein